jgi:hypothetical protein
MPSGYSNNTKAVTSCRYLFLVSPRLRSIFSFLLSIGSGFAFASFFSGGVGCSGLGFPDSGVSVLFNMFFRSEFLKRKTFFRIKYKVVYSSKNMIPKPPNVFFLWKKYGPV